MGKDAILNKVHSEKSSVLPALNTKKENWVSIQKYGWKINKHANTTAEQEHAHSHTYNMNGIQRVKNRKCYVRKQTYTYRSRKREKEAA